jgi:hypothetical protein
MAVDYNTISNKVFKIIKGSGHDVKMYDSATGNETVNPEESRYFYVKEPNYMVHIDSDNSEIKLHQGAEKTDEKVKGVINNIKHISKSYMLDFDHRIFGKELKPKNYAYKVDQNRTEKQMTDIQTEGYTPLQGSTKTSEQKLEGVKVIVRHNKAVDETSRGARSRNIQGIFVETSEGERFKYPHIHLNGARAMARHVHAGGKPHDEVGEAIVNLSDQLAKLKEVTKYARRFSQVQEQAADVLPLVDEKIAKIKNTIHKLTTASGYADFSENYKATETTEPTIEALEELKGKFTVTKFDEKIGEVLPLLQSIVDEAKAEQDNTTPAMAQRIMQRLKSGEEVELMSPAKTDYDPEQVGAFTNKEAKISFRLADLAGRIKDDEMSVFLSRLSDKYGHMHTSRYAPKPTEIENQVAKAIIKAASMKTVKPEPEALPKAEDVVPNPEAELEEAVAPFGEDESFVTEAMACNCDENCACGGNCGSNCNCHTGCEPMSEAHDIKDKEDYMAKKKELQRIQMDPNTHKDEELKKELMRRKAELDAEAKEKGMKEEPMTQADLDSERFADMHDFEEYKDAVMSDIKDPKSMYAGKSKQEIIAMLRKEADSIGYADVSDGDRHPSEPTWLNAIADEMENEKIADTTEASGYEGTSEPFMHTIRVDGDFDMDRGITDKDCDEMESLLGKAGIKASCEPNEMIQGGVNIHTMSPERAVVDVLSKAGYEVNEQADEDQNIQRIKDLAGL